MEIQVYPHGGAAMQSDEKEIRELVERWISASSAGDIETVLSLMTDDVVFLTPGRPPMVGKQAFAEASKGQSEQPFDMSGVSAVQEVQVYGDWAYMWTELSIVVTLKESGRSIRRNGHTLSILKKEGGKWLLARDANMLTVSPGAAEGE